MGKIFQDDLNRVGFRRDDEESLYPLPGGARNVLDIDFGENVELLFRLESALNAFTFVAGVLHFQGVPVVLQPDSPRRLLRRTVRLLNGQQVQDLTNQDFRRLVAVLLAERGWLDRNGRIAIE
jgi:hypothetical protein